MFDRQLKHLPQQVLLRRQRVLERLVQREFAAGSVSSDTRARIPCLNSREMLRTSSCSSAKANSSAHTSSCSAVS